MSKCNVPKYTSSNYAGSSLLEDLLDELAYLNLIKAFEVYGCLLCSSVYLSVPLTVLALLADPVDSVEVIISPYTRDGLLQEVQQVGGAARCPTPIRHGVVRP